MGSESPFYLVFLITFTQTRGNKPSGQKKQCEEDVKDLCDNNGDIGRIRWHLTLDYVFMRRRNKLTHSAVIKLQYPEHELQKSSAVWMLRVYYASRKLWRVWRVNCATDYLPNTANSKLHGRRRGRSLPSCRRQNVWILEWGSRRKTHGVCMLRTATDREVTVT